MGRTDLERAELDFADQKGHFLRGGPRKWQFALFGFACLNRALLKGVRPENEISKSHVFYLFAFFRFSSLVFFGHESMVIRANPLPRAFFCFFFFVIFLTFLGFRARKTRARARAAPRLVSRNDQKMTYFWDLIRVREGSDLMGQKMSLSSHS